MVGIAAAESAVKPRVVSLDWALAETMLAIGVTPVAVVAADDWAQLVVEPALPASVADLGLAQDVNFELIADLRPTLILTSPFLKNLEHTLRRIAPVVPLSVFDEGGAPLGQRRVVTLTLGDLLDRHLEAEQYLERAEQTFDAERTRLAALSPRPLLLLNFIDARHVRVYGGSSLYQNVLARLGLSNAWNRPTGYFGYATVGVEQLATDRDLHCIVFDPVPPDAGPTLRDSPLWSRLPFVRAGHVSFLPPTLMFGAMPAALRFARLLTTTLEAVAS